jgi:hypothetical protein
LPVATCINLRQWSGSGWDPCIKSAHILIVLPNFLYSFSQLIMRQLALPCKSRNDLKACRDVRRSKSRVVVIRTKGRQFLTLPRRQSIQPLTSSAAGQMRTVRWRYSTALRDGMGGENIYKSLFSAMCNRIAKVLLCGVLGFMGVWDVAELLDRDDTTIELEGFGLDMGGGVISW